MSISFHIYLLRQNRKTILGLLIPAFLSLALCYQSHAEEIDFDRDIAPLLKEHCWDCHSGKEPDSKLNLDRRVGALSGGDYGQPAIVPGKPEKSFMIDVINHRDPELKMPPDEKKLPQKSIALLTRWVKEGASWPGQMKDVVEKKSGHWSFQPVRRPDVPLISGMKNSNPIDAFL
ncbi:c-type cytochrome domain-containing protein, partial [uncultured Gimesia sp.]|uniref:c-type cytochrome domain-containing protein n=1 Tax=uncultured Gimesia sp. TaxID=1678688 RepID=UPI0026201A2E